MESRKLGNKTKIIKLMSNVGNYGFDYSNTQTPNGRWLQIDPNVLKLYHKVYE